MKQIKNKRNGVVKFKNPKSNLFFLIYTCDSNSVILYYIKIYIYSINTKTKITCAIYKLERKQKKYNCSKMMSIDLILFLFKFLLIFEKKKKKSERVQNRLFMIKKEEKFQFV